MASRKKWKQINAFEAFKQIDSVSRRSEPNLHTFFQILHFSLHSPANQFYYVPLYMKSDTKFRDASHELLGEQIFVKLISIACSKN